MVHHLAIFALILSLPLGIVAVYQVSQAYRRYNQRYLYTFAAMLIVLNIAVVLNLVNNYIFANIYTRFASKPAIVIESIYRFLAAMLNLVWTYIFVVFCRKLLQKQPTGLFKGLYFGTGIPLAIATIFYLIYSLVTVNVFPIRLVNHITIFLIQMVVMITIIYLLRRNRNVEDKGKQKAIRIVGRALLVSFGIAIFCSLLYLYDVVGNAALVFSAAQFLGVLYGMPVFFLKPFLDTYHGPLEKDRLIQNVLDRRFKKYNISPREQEIIRLICRGKTNKQIEDELYIALQTVKDHVSRIYQKTGAKNRVQLTNMFRDWRT
jgi:DNA-binding CsgD family transcriptional regulator